MKKHSAPLFQLELFPVNDFTQCWTLRSPTWRHLDEGGFDQRLYEVGIIDSKTASDFIIMHHYSASSPAGVLNFVLFERDLLVGVAILNVPVSGQGLTKLFSDLVPYSESLDLGRFCLLYRVPSNGETFMLARCFELARLALPKKPYPQHITQISMMNAASIS